MLPRTLRRWLAPIACWMFVCVLAACSTTTPTSCCDDPAIAPGNGPEQPGTIADRPSGATSPTIEFLYIPDCPNARALNRSLTAALGLMDAAWPVARVNQMELPERDPRRGYPAPTILVNGQDIEGLPVPSGAAWGPACRDYPNGVPDPKELAAKLKAAATK